MYRIARIFELYIQFICSSESLLQKEIKFIIDLFVDNGHDRPLLEKVALSYKPPTTTQDHTNKNKRITNNNKHNCSGLS